MFEHRTSKFTLKLLICNRARQLIPINFATFINCITLILLYYLLFKFKVLCMFYSKAAFSQILLLIIISCNMVKIP